MHTILGRHDHEIAHGKKLAAEGAESIWNWSSPAGRRRADRRARELVSAGKIGPTDKALEIGCGTGLFTRKVWQLSGADITATDISEELLTLAREAGGIGSGRYVLDDAMSMAFSDDSFDVVFGSSILHHLDFSAALNEIYRVLKPGGRIVFAEPNMLNPQIFIQKNIPAVKRALGDSPDETAVVRFKLSRDMKEIGYSNVRIRPYDFLHPMTPGMLVPAVERLGIIAENIPLLREIAGSVIISAEKPKP